MNKKTQQDCQNKNDYISMYGIDWTGDGKTDMVDDLISMDHYERTRKLNEDLKDEGGWIGSCLHSLFCLPFLAVAAFLKAKGII